MIRHLRSPVGRALLALASVALGAVVFVGVAGAEAGDGISASGATVDKVGWWHRQNVATATPAAIVTSPPPPGVPAGTLAVGAVNGEPDRITAIGILPDASPGDTISSFTMSIKEAGSPAAGFNGTAAKIVACPIDSFWVGGENGVWDNRPTYSCSLASAPGERGLDGTWSFDLKAIGDAWVDPNGTLAADGIVLVEEVAAPEGFQTVFATSGDGAIVVTLAYEQGTDTTDTGFEPDFGGGSTGGDFGGSTGGSGGFDSPSFGGSGGAAPVGGLPTPEVSTPTAGETPQDAPPVARNIASTSPNILGNFPGGLVLAVPLFIVLLGLLTFSLGPLGEPAAATRQRGVSRALAARARLDGPSSSPSPMETT